MSIKKIISIDNVGRFVRYNAAGDVAFKKLNLIYGENGCGKTTLCSILRSFRVGDPSYIHCRKTLGIDNNSPKVRLLLDHTSANFSGLTWSVTEPNIHIYDSEFVQKNIFASSVVEHEQKKNLYKIIMGEAGVKIAKEIERLDGVIAALNTKIKDQEHRLFGFCDGMTVEEFRKIPMQDNIEATITVKQSQLEQEKKKIKEKKDILQKVGMSKIDEFILPTDIINILKSSIDNVIVDAEEMLKNHMRQINMPKNGQQWISQGIGFVKDDICPFCGQSIVQNELITAYKSFFNAEYMNLKARVETLDYLLENLGHKWLSQSEIQYERNLTVKEYWKQFLDINTIDLSFETLKETLSKLVALLKNLVAIKKQNVLEAVSISSEIETCFAFFKTFNTQIADYNSKIGIINTHIADYKQKLESETPDVSKLQSEIGQLNRVKTRYSAEVVSIFDEYNKLETEKKSQSEEKNNQKKLLDEYTQNILSQYEQSINKHLQNISAGFKIVNIKGQYKGGTPSSVYQLQVRGQNIDISSNNNFEPTFSTALSTGDRNLLAFVFFIASLEQDPMLQDKIVVFDDPFTSMDLFRKRWTSDVIRRVSEKAAQTIVCSHDKYFLKMLKDSYHDASLKTFELFSNNESVNLKEWDIDADTEDSYLKDFTILSSYDRDRSGDVLDVHAAIRRFLEAYLRYHFPGIFKEDQWLGDYIGMIRNADQNSALIHVKSDLDELTDINNYSKDSHHARRDDISPEELAGFVRRTLQVVCGSQE